MSDKPSVLRPNDAASLQLARTLARGARFGAIGVLDPDSGHPLTSRVLLATDVDGVPVMIGSELATHTRALIADPRCSILVGEPGKGDPLAWPRLTIVSTAERIERDHESYSHIRARFLRRHPKSGLYVDFPDFSFFKLNPNSANLNAGFGKAHVFSGSDLVIDSQLNNTIAINELQLLAQLNAVRGGVPNSEAIGNSEYKTGNWRLTGVDASGFDIASGGKIIRHELSREQTDLDALIVEYQQILK